MNIDRASVERREDPKTATGPAENLREFIASRTNFASALQQQRQKAPVTQSREARPSGQSESRRAVSRDTPEAETNHPLADTEAGVPSELPAFRPLLSILSATAGSSAPTVAAATGGAARPARRRGAEVSDAAACIEVTHPRTGTRFLLSQKDGVWLVSLQDQPPMSAAELESLLQDLRAQFAQRGLGAVDVIA